MPLLWWLIVIRLLMNAKPYALRAQTARVSISIPSWPVMVKVKKENAKRRQAMTPKIAVPLWRTWLITRRLIALMLILAKLILMQVKELLHSVFRPRRQNTSSEPEYAKNLWPNSAVKMLQITITNPWLETAEIMIRMVKFLTKTTSLQQRAEPKRIVNMIALLLKLAKLTIIKLQQEPANYGSQQSSKLKVK